MKNCSSKGPHLGMRSAKLKCYQENMYNKISTVTISIRTLEILYILETELLNAKYFFFKKKPLNLGTVNTKLKQKSEKDQCKGV